MFVPQGLPVTPAGEYVERSLLAWLEKNTPMADLAPMHRLDRDTAGLVLVRIVEVAQTEPRPVPQKPQELPGMVAAGHDHDPVDAGAGHLLDRVIDHRPVVDRQQMLVGDPRQRLQPTPGPSGQNHTFHARSHSESRPLPAGWLFLKLHKRQL